VARQAAIVPALMAPPDQTRSFGDVGSVSDLLESGHGRAIHEDTPSHICNRPAQGWMGHPAQM